MNDAQTFLSWMFDDLTGTGQSLVIWTASDKKARFFTDPEEAGRTATRLGRQTDTYYGVCSLETVPAVGRGKLGNVGGVPALWADLDFGPVHKKENLPPDENSCNDLLRQLGLEPSILVHSGHGLHAYWLLDAAEIVDSAQERNRMALIARRWHATILACAKTRGWTFDAVSDLTRILRVPGTLNHKRVPAEPVRILGPQFGEPKTYPLDLLDEFMVPEADLHPTRRVQEPVAPVKPNPSGAVPVAVTVLCENDPKFKKTWDKQRSDLQDGTPSSYDYSLALQMVAAGCSDQDIADAIYARRLKHAEAPEKALRRDYMMRTIGRAKNAMSGVLAVSEAEEILEKAAGGTAVEEQTYAQISKALGIKVLRFQQQGEENSQFSLVLDDGTDIRLGTIREVLSQDRFREAVAERTGEVVRVMKRDVWHRLVQVMLHVAQKLANEEARRDNQMWAWLQQYMEAHGVILDDSDEEGFRAAVEQGSPFVQKGKLFVHVPSLCHYLKFQTAEVIKKETVWDALRICGFEGRRISLRHGARIRCKYFWVGPEIPT